MQSLQTTSSIATLTFVVACMATAGLSLSLSEIAAPLSGRRRVLSALAANFVLAPGLAYGLTRLVPLERGHAIGLLLLGGAAGAPFLPKLAGLARGDLAYSVGLMLILMVGSVVFMPLALPVLIPGLAADPWQILQPLLWTMLLPLGLGMLVKNRWPRAADRLGAVAGWISNLSLVLAVLLLLGLHLPAMLGTFGSGAALTGSGFVLLALGAGYVLGGAEAGVRSTLALGTGQRNVAAAMLLAGQNFPDEPAVMVMVLVTTFAGLVVLMVAARLFATAISSSARSASS